MRESLLSKQTTGKHEHTNTAFSLSNVKQFVLIKFTFSFTISVTVFERIVLETILLKDYC